MEAARVRNLKAKILLERMPVRRGSAQMSEDEYLRQADIVAASVDRLRLKHAGFAPGLTPVDGAVGEGGDTAQTGFQSGSRLSKEELRERLEVFKFARRVEPELPPLEPIEDAAPEPRKEQALVHFNSSAGAIARYGPDAKVDSLMARVSQRNARHLEVAGQRRERKEARIALKREAAEKAMNRCCFATQMGESAPPGALAPYGSLAGAWLAIAALVGFAKVAQEEVHFCRLSPRDQHKYVEQRFEALESGTMRAGKSVAKVVELKKAMDSPEFLGCRDLIACRISAKFTLRRARRSLRCVTECLQSWQPGMMFMLCKRMLLRVRLVQKWWRIWRKQLHEVREKVGARWHRLEGELGKKEVNADMRSGKKDKSGLNLSPELLVESKRVGHAVQMRFIVHELRARRYFLLPQIRIWEEDNKRLGESHKLYVETAQAMKTLGVESEEVPMFLFPTPQPSYIPTDAEIVEMIHRARKRSDGWTQIPLDPAMRWSQPQP